MVGMIDKEKKKICKQCNENEVSKFFNSPYCNECIQWRFELLEKGIWKQ